MQLNFKKILIVVGLVIGFFSVFSFADVLTSFDYDTFDIIGLFAKMLYPIIGLGAAAVLVTVGLKYKD